MVKIIGYRTKQKDIVLGCLCANSSCSFSAKEIYSLCKQQGTPVGLATVYRHLDRLCHSGKVKRILEEDGGLRFQFLNTAGADCQGQFYLKCHKCGKITPAHCTLLGQMAAHMNEQHGFTVDVDCSVLYGLCSSCK